MDFDANGGGARYEADGNGTGSLALGGSGGDGEIIVHEYGHAVQDNQCPGCYDVGPLGEGFADFLAAAYFIDQSGGFQDTCLFEWSQRFNPSQPACLRRVDTTKRYPDDLVGEPHLDGEIWSGALWDVLLALGNGTVTVAGRDLTLKLVLESHFLAPEDPSYFEAAEALLEADRLLFDGAHATLLESKLAARGIWTPRPGPIVLGRGGGRTDCDGAFSYANATNRHGPTSSKQVCVDNDPACDADAVPGVCTFRVAACFGLRGFTNCSPASTIAFRLRAPRLDSGSPVSAVIAEALVASVAAAPGAIRDAEDRALVLWNFSPGLAPGACAPPADLVVPLRQQRGQFRRRSVRLGIETLGNRPEGEPTDSDRLTLTCLPRSS